ncbi:MAG: AMP-binding protein, partial [Proteobacteria bacterium]|nr:AMP-binding protein [Pseudomonadota bacterium]
MSAEPRMAVDSLGPVRDIEEDTLPKLLRRNFNLHPDKDAIRVKDMGIWVTYSWRDYYENVKYFCLGLKSLGLKKGETVSIIGENKPEWFWAELAVQAAGGVVSGIFVDCGPPEVKYFLEAGDSGYAVAHDQEQVDKFLAIKEEVPHLKKVIYWDPKGLWSYEDPILASFEEVQALGREYEKDHPGIFEENIDQGRGEDISLISWTSGTTGLPKGAMLTHRYLVENVTDWSRLDGWYRKGYEYVSFIPPAWGTEQLAGIAGGLMSELVVNFPEEPETVQENIREIGPQLLFYGARQWESVNRLVQARMIDSTWFRRLTYKLFMPVGLKLADTRIAGKEPGPRLRFLHFLAHQCVFKYLRDRLGLSRVRVAYSGGGALSPNIIRHFMALGVEIKLAYGATEVGLISIPRTGELRPETTGRPLPWVDVRFSDDGEILVKSKYMYAGYYKNPEASRKKLDADGYYQTGDFGHLDETGHLIVIDRMEDLKPLAGGKKFSPQFAEVR